MLPTCLQARASKSGSARPAREQARRRGFEQQCQNVRRHLEREIDQALD